MLAQNKSGWKLIKYIDIKEEDIGQYHNVTGRYLLNYESIDFTGFSWKWSKNLLPVYYFWNLSYLPPHDRKTEHKRDAVLK